jgi:uncharacterized hydrophobic protein (TIGR00271 family)
MSTVSEVLLVRASTDHALVEQARAYAAARGCEAREVSLAELLAEPQHLEVGPAHVVAIVDEENVGAVVHGVTGTGHTLGLLPSARRGRLHDWLRLPLDREAQLALAFSSDSAEIDVLRCNDEVALGSVMLGDTPFLDRRSKSFRNRRDSRLGQLVYLVALILAAVRNVFAIRPLAVTLTTRSDQRIKTALTGLVAIEHEIYGAAARLISTAGQDGKFSTLLIAPKSAMEYLAFLLANLFRGARPPKRLPAAAGHIKSNYLKVDSQAPLAYFIDGEKRVAKTLELELARRALRVNVGPDYHERFGGQEAAKDTVKVEHLPQDELRLRMIQRRLPVFTRADEEDFKELFVQLREGARLSGSYISLMVLSTLIASFGMFLSSAAVVIGAMVLAPLMAPIISLAMGLVRSERGLLRGAAFTIAGGVLLSLGVAAVVALLIPIERVTSEIAARLEPSLLDLGVAVACGVAGAYAHARESVMKSLPGVAIAVALVPPLCVAGIGLGWLDLRVVQGAFLLFVTNLVGIALAASLTFLVLGYAPIVRARRGLVISLLMLLLVSIPLSLSFQRMHHGYQLERALVAEPYVVGDERYRLDAVNVRAHRSPLVIRAELVGEQPVTADTLAAVREEVERRLGRPVTLELSFRWTHRVERD